MSLICCLSENFSHKLDVQKETAGEIWTWVSTSDSKNNNSNNQYQVIGDIIDKVTHLVVRLRW